MKNDEARISNQSSYGGLRSGEIRNNNGFRGKKMNKRRFFLVGVYGLVLLGLSSCAGYQRNYTGAALPIEEVAFLFNDDSSVHGDLGLEGVVDKSVRINVTTIPDAYGALDRLLGMWPYCRELLPGTYAVEAWKTKRASSQH